jgi:hypothetical protein
MEEGSLCPLLLKNSPFLWLEDQCSSVFKDKPWIRDTLEEYDDNKLIELKVRTKTK